MKSLLFLLGLIINLTLQSQIKYTLKGGLNLPNADFSYYNGQQMKTKTNPTWGFGLLVDVPVKMLIIQTGLNYQNKGFYLEENEVDDFSGDIYTTRTTVSYDFVELPVTIGKKFPLSENLSLQVNFGVWAAAALSGKSKQEYLINGVDFFQENYNFEFGGSEDLTRMDYGITMGANLNWKGILLGTTYSPSRFNMSKDDYYSIYNKLTQIYIGYQF